MENTTAARKFTVICRTDADNWDDDKMNFADYSQVRYDLYNLGEVEGCDPLETLTHAEFEARGYRTSDWGNVHPDGRGEISQCGDAEEAH